MTKTLGERGSILVDFTVVHVGAAATSIARAARAPSPAVRRREWSRVEAQAEKAIVQLQALAKHARERAGASR